MKKILLAISCIFLLTLSVLNTNTGILHIPYALASEEFTVDIKASKSTVEPKRLFIYTITISNEGDSDATEPILTLSLDEDIEFISASNSGGKKGNSVQWEGFSLNAGESKTVNVSVKAGDDAIDGDELFATAFIGNGFDETSVKVEDKEDANNDDERAVTIELFSNKSQIEPTEPYAMIVRVQNNGKRNVKDIEVTVELSEKIEFLSAANKGKFSGNTIIWNKIDLDANESRNLTASVRATDEIAHLDSLTSIAYAEGSVHEHTISVWDPDNGNEYMEVHAFTNDDEIEAGGNIEYIIRVKNLADRKERINIKANIDSNTIFSSASDGGIQYDKTIIQWNDILFEQSETKSFTLTVQIKNAAPERQQLRFFAQAGRGRKDVFTSVKPATATGNVIAAEKSMHKKPAAVSPLAVYQAADKSEAQPGSLVNYTISLRNTGENTLSHLEVLEQFSNEKLDIEKTENGNLVQNGITWKIDKLLPNQKWTKKYSAKIHENIAHGTTIRRTLSVSGDKTLIASAQKTTGVISQLPQAGFGSFSLAAKDGQAFLRLPKAHATERNTTATEKKRSQESRYILLWVFTLIAGIPVGIITGKKVLE